MRRLSLAFLALTVAALGAQADEWPSKPIHAVIPFGPGSATDIIPRVVFDKLGALLGQPIIVENKGGAGSTLGAGVVAKADPDGYTILATSSAHTIAPSLYSALSYDPARDFATVGIIGSSPNVLIISPDKGLKTVQDFVAAAKAKPGTFTFASVGVGSAVHMSAERFRMSAGYEAVHVPFKGGAEALTEVLAGRVDYYFCPIATALPLIRDGKLLALAVSSRSRAAQLPDVPTTLESGYKDSDYSFWIGVFAPAATPRDIVDKLNAEMIKAVQSPEVKEKLAALGVVPAALSPSEFDAQVKSELVNNPAFAKAAGMKMN